jgi:hypothetical protein
LQQGISSLRSYHQDVGGNTTIPQQIGSSSVFAPQLSNQSWAPNQNHGFESTQPNVLPNLHAPPPQEEISADYDDDPSSESFSNYDEEQQSVKKPKKVKRKAKSDKDSSSSNKPKKARAAASDTFNPTTTSQDGRLYFEGYEILKLPTGFHQCLLFHGLRAVMALIG